METPLPTVEKSKSLNVEESRAKRLERQQARLRDRGGIFRPENRNTNLFDMLCQATHRRSPRKDRGRSKSRSVSPVKKKQTVKSFTKHTNLEGSSKTRTSPRKTTNITSTAIRDVGPRSKSKGAKGKQRQEDTTLEGAEDGEKTKARPKAKNTTTNPRKSVGRARPRTKKKSTADEPLECEDPDLRTGGHTTKLRRKRKKIDAEDVEAEKDPPPKPKKSKATKAQTSALHDDGPIIEDSINIPRSQNRPQARSRPRGKQRQWKQGGGNSQEKANLSEPSGGTRADVTDEVAVKSQSGPIESVGNQEPVAEDDPSQTKRRRAPSEEQSGPKRPTKSNSGTFGHESKLEMSLHKIEGEAAAMTLAGAINGASGKRALAARESAKSNRAPKEPKLTEHPPETTAPLVEAKKPVHSHISTHEIAGPADGPRLKRKRSVGQSEVGEETLPVGKVAKKTNVESTGRTKEVSNQEAPVVVTKSLPKKSIPSSKSERKSKPRSTKTISRKQKENTVLVEPTTRGASTIKVKVGTEVNIKMPAHVKHRLKTAVHHQVDYHSDGEPDPIDFLS